MTTDLNRPIQIGGSEAHHAVVKRLHVGDEVELFDGAGLVARAVLDRNEKRTITARVLATRMEPAPVPRISIAAPVPKGSRAEIMVEQLSQTAATDWTPLLTERSVSEPRESRIEKWRFVTAIEAAKQCRRDHLLAVRSAMTLDEVLAKDHESRLFAERAAERLDLGEASKARSILIIIGPEGGLTDDEVSYLRRAGVIGFNLGPYVLRVESAAVIAASLVSQAVHS